MFVTKAFTRTLACLHCTYVILCVETNQPSSLHEVCREVLTGPVRHVVEIRIIISWRLVNAIPFNSKLQVSDLMGLSRKRQMSGTGEHVKTESLIRCRKDSIKLNNGQLLYYDDFFFFYTHACTGHGRLYTLCTLFISRLLSLHLADVFMRNNVQMMQRQNLSAVKAKSDPRIELLKARSWCCKVGFPSSCSRTERKRACERELPTQRLSC